MILARQSVTKGRVCGAGLADLVINGFRSGRKIIEILRSNPSKDPEKYSEDEIAHMRKVVSYNKRHLAQEEKAKQDTNSKSYKSLKNWGHDPQKT